MTANPDAVYSQERDAGARKIVHGNRLSCCSVTATIHEFRRHQCQNISDDISTQSKYIPIMT